MDDPIRVGRGGRRREKQARKNGVEVEASVEAVLLLSGVAMNVFPGVKRMAGAREGWLQLARQRLAGAKTWQFEVGCAAAGNCAFVRAAAGRSIRGWRWLARGMPSIAGREEHSARTCCVAWRAR